MALALDSAAIDACDLGDGRRSFALAFRFMIASSVAPI
jgi:hypothetical protein